MEVRFGKIGSMKNKFKAAAIFFFFAIANINCAKTNNTSLRNCYKVKYTGEGCWSEIEVLDGDMQQIKLAAWQNSRQEPNLRQKLGFSGIPEKFKDGNIFYLKILEIDSNVMHVQYCTTPKYQIKKYELTNENCDNL